MKNEISLKKIVESKRLEKYIQEMGKILIILIGF